MYYFIIHHLGACGNDGFCASRQKPANPIINYYNNFHIPFPERAQQLRVPDKTVCTSLVLKLSCNKHHNIDAKKLDSK